jgi:hypothetical protein
MSTPWYGLTEPFGSDPVEVSAINNNMDNLDTNLKAVADQFGYVKTPATKWEIYKKYYVTGSAGSGTQLYNSMQPIWREIWTKEGEGALSNAIDFRKEGDFYLNDEGIYRISFVLVVGVAVTTDNQILGYIRNENTALTLKSSRSYKAFPSSATAKYGTVSSSTLVKVASAGGEFTPGNRYTLWGGTSTGGSVGTTPELSFPLKTTITVEYVRGL